jgi:hypothetical protein
MRSWWDVRKAARTAHSPVLKNHDLNTPTLGEIKVVVKIDYDLLTFADSI